jgi:hypothetical protein
MQYDPLMILGILALALLAFGLGRWFQKQQDPLVQMGKLIDAEYKIAQRIAALKTGETAEQIAEKTRQAKVKADTLALDQKNLGA